MRIDVTGHHMEITPALKQHVEKKMAKLQRHVDHISHMHVVLTIEKERQKAEATLHVDHHDLFATDEQDDMYKAIDHLATKLDRLLLKHKEKLSSHRVKQHDRGDAG